MRVEVVVRKGLGKNMDSVFSMKNVADVIDNPKVPEPKSSLPLSALKPGKFQPRNDVENSGLAELAQSIKQNGILNPIVVRKLSSDKYEILAGERRYQAAKIAGLKKVPVTILDVSDKQAMIVGLVENLQRKDLNALETAEGIQRLIEEFKYSHEGVAEAIGRSRPMISNLLRLLGLPEAVKTMLSKSGLPSKSKKKDSPSDRLRNTLRVIKKGKIQARIPIKRCKKARNLLNLRMSFQKS